MFNFESLLKVHKYPLLWRRDRVTSLRPAVSSRVWIFNKKIFLPGTKRDGRAEPQSLVSVPKIQRLNIKFLHSVYVVKAYVLLTAIRPSNGEAKPDCPLDAFRKSRLCRHRISPSSSHFNHSYNTTFEHNTHPWHSFLKLQMHFNLQCSPPKWCRYRKWATLLPLSAVNGAQTLKIQRVGIITLIHT